MKHVVIINRMAKQKNLKELLKEMETTFRARALPYAIHLTKGSAEADAMIHAAFIYAEATALCMRSSTHCRVLPMN